MDNTYDTKRATITVNDVTYDVVEIFNHNRGATEYTLSLNDEDVFDGLRGLIATDDDPGHFNPRDNSNVGVISVFYRGYTLGDEDISDVNFEVECVDCDKNWCVGIHATAEKLVVGSEEECQKYIDNLPDVATGRYYIEPLNCGKCEDGYRTLNPVEYFKKERGARVVLPCIVYEHSGITMRVGRVGDIVGDAAGWDTSFVGFMFDTSETLKETMGDDVTDEEIEKALRSEMEEYASYLEGDIVYYKVEDDNTNFDEQCGGFVGNHSGCEDECYAAMMEATRLRLIEETERIYWLARDVITVG